MKNKKNELWKLDLLEVKFKRANPRFPNTKKLLNAKNNSQLLKKLPRTQDEASKQILALKSDLFEKKFHGSYKKLLREVQRKVNQDQRAWTEAQKSLSEFFGDSNKVELLIKSRLIKLVTVTILTTKELKNSPPDYIPGHLKALITDKSNAANPSHFFITYCQNDKVLNGYISKMWNAKDFKELLGEIEWSFRKIRGDLTQGEKDARAKATGTKVKGVVHESEEEVDENDSLENEEEPMDAEEAFDKFAGFDNMVGDSDEEQEFVADPNVNYNEITDEEASESEDEFFDEEKVPKSAQSTSTHKLPQLATGYFSGGSDDEEDVDNDKVVKEATTVRKNRRGQRARQKIWEQKYGSGANHVKKERDRVASEREQRQLEFEERQRKRELKAARSVGADPTGSHQTSSALAAGPMHPSWAAKKKAEEKLKNVKFEGKKITFD